MYKQQLEIPPLPYEVNIWQHLDNIFYTARQLVYLSGDSALEKKSS